MCPSLSSADGELEQIDFIDSSVEEDEEGRSRAGGDRSSLSSQFMAYIERRITSEVRGLYLEVFTETSDQAQFTFCFHGLD